jgi:type VI protein secretion system component Hcp
MAFEAYIKIDGIGTTSDKGIQLESFSWGVSNSTAPSTSQEGGGAVSFTDFSFTSQIGQHSPQLFEKCATGEHLSAALLTIYGTPMAIYIKLGDVLVSNYSINEQALQKVRDEINYKFTTAFSAVPMDSISLNFSKIEFDFNGTVGSGGGGSTKFG